MTPGPDQIIACPHCGGLEQYATLRSGNTFGARTYTDGRQIAPMLPKPPPVVKCRHCAAFYWLRGAREVGEINDPWGEGRSRAPEAWAAAQSVQEPTEAEYYDAIGAGLAESPEQERSLRIFAWWRRNDALRDAGPDAASAASEAPERWRANLEALLPLLDDANPNDLVMRAEVYRELGHFDSARRALALIGQSEYSAVVKRLGQLCDERDTQVRSL
jgi:hypothetical protein